MGRLRSPLLLFIVLSFIVGALAETYNVIDHGAVGDGKTDDTKAFLATWSATCADTTNPTFLVPNGKTFIVGQLSFKGPCKSNVYVQVNGNILRPNKDWGEVAAWIQFSDINGLRIDGSGQFDGQGSVYWPIIKKRAYKFGPRTMSLAKIQNVTLSGLTFKNSCQMHIVVGFSSNIVISHLNISAPGDSPNTDGIHIQECSNVQIIHSTIGTGDDCISVGTGTTNLNISDITCGPGHGISIGSLGKGKTEARVEQISVRNCSINGATNGVRIKTWQGGSGYAKGILFENIDLTAVSNPILINQFYCDHEVCTSQTSAVKVSDVQYIGITGTSASEVAINFNCSQSVPCQGIVMENVNIQPAKVRVGQAALPNGRHKTVLAETSYCHNAYGEKKGTIVPDVPCLNAA